MLSKQLKLSTESDFLQSAEMGSLHASSKRDRSTESHGSAIEIARHKRIDGLSYGPAPPSGLLMRHTVDGQRRTRRTNNANGLPCPMETSMQRICSAKCFVPSSGHSKNLECPSAPPPSIPPSHAQRSAYPHLCRKCLRPRHYGALDGLRRHRHRRGCQAAIQLSSVASSGSIHARWCKSWT